VETASHLNIKKERNSFNRKNTTSYSYSSKLVSESSMGRKNKEDNSEVLSYRDARRPVGFVDSNFSLS